MDFKPVFTDFEKRYGKKCECAYFVGKPIIFFSSAELTVSAAVSAGGFSAAAKRDDERIIIQFSDSMRFLNSSVLDLEYQKGEKIFDELFTLRSRGVKIGGVQLLFSRKTGLLMPEELMLAASLGAFCKNPPRVSGFNTQIRTALVSRKDNVSVIEGESVRYLPLPDSELKIVLCNIREKTEGGKINFATPTSAVEALESYDFEKFGTLLNRRTSEILKKSKGMKKSRELFFTATRLADSYGSGILPEGGIFSLVKNSRVDAFIHNLGSEYEKYYGSFPDFYVTRAEDSGIPVSPEG